MARLRALAPAGLVLLARPAAAEVFDPDFVQSVVVAPAGQAGTSGLAWAPDGSNRLFYARQTGVIRIVENGVLLAKPFAAISPVFSDPTEAGVIGLAFDPNYVVNRYVYAFVTVSATEQQIIRYTDQNNVGVDKTVVVAGLPTRGVNHNGGAVGFGPDGKLYWAIGDLGSKVGANDDLSSLAAKVARANADGSAPPDNPFFDADGPNEDRIWARGFRNPFSFTWQPSTDRLWVNVTGAMYEQIFTPLPGDHAGWDKYQNNQPQGFLAPRIAYRSARSDRWDIAANGAVRTGGVATFTTTLPHRLRIGTKVTISGVDDPSFDTSGFVTEVHSPTRFSIDQAGPDATGGGGLVTTLELGGALTGGTFWDSNSVPESYRGDFFFGDFNSGNIVRATLDADNVVTSVDIWATTASRMIDLAVGPDGDLYYATYNGGISKLRYDAVEQGLVVSQLHTRVVEGGIAVFNVRLAVAPEGPTEVRVERESGDADVTVEQSSLLFDASNWSVPQPVRIHAAHDADAAQDEALLSVTSPDIVGEHVVVRVTDDDPVSLILQPSTVTLGEGTSGELQISLNGPPGRPVTVEARVEPPDNLLVTSGVPIEFDADDWSTPKLVGLVALEDPDTEDETLSLIVSADWLGSVEIPVRIVDDDSSGGDAGPGDAGGSGLGNAGDAGRGSGGDSGHESGGAPGRAGGSSDGGSHAGAGGVDGTTADVGDENPASDSADGGCGCALAKDVPGSPWAHAIFGLLLLRRARRSRH